MPDVKENKFEYKVIGWTLCTDNCYPTDKNCCREKYDALIADVRANGYVFGGDVHEDYCPVFNDGTKLSFSWRGWGGVMAAAWLPENKDPYKYSLYYMDRRIDPEKKKRPKSGVDAMLIENKVWRDVKLSDEELWDIHVFKTLILRPLTPELGVIENGDFINFIDADIPDITFCARVVSVFRAQTLEELLPVLDEEMKYCWNDLSQQLGYEENLPSEELLAKLKEKYPQPPQDGFCAIEYRWL